MLGESWFLKPVLNDDIDISGGEKQKINFYYAKLEPVVDKEKKSTS